MKVNQIISSLLIITMIGLASCSSSNEETTVEKVNIPSDPIDELYTVTTTQFKAANMEWGKLELHDFHQSVKSNGIFDLPPENKASVSAYFGGYVKELHLLPGQKIRKGQTLFILENPDYIQLQQEFLEAKGQLKYLLSDYERQKNLVQNNVTSQKNFLKAEADYTVTRVKCESLKKKLRLMNINPDKLNVNTLRTTMAVFSPLNGFVTNVNVTKGMYLNPADIAITIIDTEHMHLELTIFEKDLASVAVGQLIKFKTQNDVNKEFDASVYLVNKSIDPIKRTVSIHGHLTDEKNTNIFTPGMYIEAEIFTSTETKISLPQESIVEMEEKHFVLIKKVVGNDVISFDKKEVTIGQSTNGSVEIINHSEFKKDTQFLTKGAFNLIVE